MLGVEQLEAILDQVTALAEPVGSFEQRAVQAVHELIPCDVVVFNVMPLADGEPVGPPRGWFEPTSMAAPIEALTSTFERWSWQHPVLQHVQQTGDLSPLRWSDVDAPEFVDSELYREFFVPLGLRHQLIMNLPSPGDVLLALSLNRATADFTDAEVEVLARLRPHLAALHRAAHSRAAMEAGLDPGWLVILTDPDAGVQSVSQPDSTGTFVAGQTLPNELHRDVDVDSRQAASGAGPLVMGAARVYRFDSGTWTVRASTGGLGPVVLAAKKWTPGEGDIGARLTAREIEVARELRAGGSNAAIAARLHVSVGTLKKHLEHLYAKLGVKDRATAVSAISSLGLTSKNGGA